MVNIEDYPDYLVVVTNSHLGESIQGLINDDTISYTTGATYNDTPMAASAKNWGVGALDQGIKRLTGAGGVASTLTKTMGTSIVDTYKMYSGTSYSGVPSVTFHVFPEDGGYKSTLSKLFNLTQPEIEAGIMKSRLYPKHHTWDKVTSGDVSSVADPFKGQLIHLDIGNWFSATGLFCTSVNYRFSKYVNRANQPIYLEVTLSFEPYKVQTSEEMLEWHR